MANKKPKEKNEISSPKNELQEPNNLLPIPNEIKQKLKPEQLKSYREVSSLLQIQAGITEHPFLKKLTSEHITNLIDNDEKANIRGCDERKDIRKSNLMIFGSILVFVIFICVFFTLTNNKDTLYEILKIMGAFAGGFGAGFGVSTYYKKQ